MNQAIQMMNSLGNGDSTSMRGRSHSFKGQVGLKSLAALGIPPEDWPFTVVIDDFLEAWILEDRGNVIVSFYFNNMQAVCRSGSILDGDGWNVQLDAIMKIVEEVWQTWGIRGISWTVGFQNYKDSLVTRIIRG
jgi:hypothetical protein